MKNPVRIPIRRKILVSVMLALTAVVSLITFTMARFFHEDKQAYINDWISIATLSTAEDARSLLSGYAQRLQLHSEIMLNGDLSQDEKLRLMQRFFDELPELVDISIYRDGEEIETASDSNALEAAGITREILLANREEHPLSVEEISKREVYIRNSTIAGDLPTLTLAFTREIEPGESPILVAAVLRLEGLMEVGSRFKVFEVAIFDESGHVLAHPDVTKVIRHDTSSMASVTSEIDTDYQAGTTVEFERDGEPMLGGFAAVDFGGVTVTTQIPKSAAYLASRALLSRLLLVALGLLVFVTLCSLLWARQLTRPVERLSAATREIAKGDFGVSVDVSSRDEIGALAGSFNQMAVELSDREQALETAHKQLIQSEKMAAFGQLGAGIAHEVKNPLAGILGCTQLSLLELETGGDVTGNLQLIEKETKRCKDIIESLMRFARQEKAEQGPIDLNHVAGDATAIVNHQLELAQVELMCDLAENLPPIRGNANQLEQVLINLLINAQQALGGEPGTVTVVTQQPDDETVELRVKDSGPGIPLDVQRKLFEPFFSTKPPGKGTGLGLSVSFGIVKDHAGDIAVESEVGSGATFVLRFPVLTEQAAAEALALEALDNATPLPPERPA